jgi:CRP-like cAMP-binding protein
MLPCLKPAISVTSDNPIVMFARRLSNARRHIAAQRTRPCEEIKREEANFAARLQQQPLEVRGVVRWITQLARDFFEQ